jgi:hypothetical protein
VALRGGQRRPGDPEFDPQGAFGFFPRAWGTLMGRRGAILRLDGLSLALPRRLRASKELPVAKGSVSAFLRFRLAASVTDGKATHFHEAQPVGKLWGRSLQEGCQGV